MIINNLAKIAGFTLLLVMLYLLDKSLMFFVDVFSSAVGQGGSGCSFGWERHGV